MIYQGMITRDPAVMVGKPCIKGTRITVELIMRKMIEGASIDYLLLAYPHITKEQILACMEYALEVMKNEEIIEVIQ